MARFPKYQRDDRTARTVLTMTGYGITQERIGKVLELDGKTLRAHYRRELDIGATEADSRVVEALYRNATKNENVTAQIWWTKARMGWKSTDVVQQNGALQVDFRWADAPAPPREGKPVVTIDAETDPDADPDLIEWAAPDPKMAND